MTTTETRKQVALALLCAAVFLDSMDLSLMTVALPAIGDDLGLPDGTLQWLVSGYAVTYGGFLLLGGRLADLLGRRRVFLLSLTVFAAASLAGGLASEGWLLILTRVVKGFAAALTAPAALSLITTTFREGPARNRAIGFYALAGALGYSVGLIASGLLTQVNWRLVFLLPVPIVVLVLIAAPFVLTAREGDGQRAARVDMGGAATVTGGVLALVYALTVLSWPAAVLAAALLGAFVCIERRHRDPLIPLGELRSRRLVGANAAALAWACATIGWQFVAVLFLQREQGYDPLMTGLGIVPMGLAIIVAARVAGRLIPRWGEGWTAATGLLVQGAGIVLFLRAGADADYATVLLPALVIHGIGNGLSFSSLNLAAVSALPDDKQGLASGLVTSAVQIGSGVGVAVLGLVLTAAGTGVGAYHTTFLAAAAFSLIGAVVAATALRVTRGPERYGTSDAAATSTTDAGSRQS
ncbi:MFS transporter [Desertihabitans aurantiacus]|uniref:MFS transporter n=1 Tax=Desertihabitans aurantiacus TaxID=2282477 RepID=UPI000DF788A8|nr:MFS transporter [Desertihabitans aurantiacus]